ncbi:polyprenyl synthetase family protein [Bacillus niameyensis]|uniref:polyprenyl synthetase family protein n=1 Tax=Bacillus niameyensis TaxID=1522308 RepID=UPI0007839681|nr:polyprenyl synthetase family protein [Bacillus niameyensis]
MYSMNKTLVNNPEECYRQAELKAAHYFQSLYVQVEQQAHNLHLTKDFRIWKRHHTRYLSFISQKKKTKSQVYDHYIQWLISSNQLDPFLDRSISYIFLRDLGHSLDSQYTQTRIANVSAYLRKQLTNKEKKQDYLSMAGLYRIAQKEAIESTIIWLIGKLRTVTANIPDKMDAEESKRKLIKVIAGVVMQIVEEMEEGISASERAKKLDKAIRLGYSYGLTYAFIDDLLDSNVLSAQEKRRYSDLIRSSLITGVVPEFGEWTSENMELMQFVHSELKSAFEYIKAQPEVNQHFFEQSYVFFQSQEIDRAKKLTDPHYTNEELYLPVILKSSYSRLIVRSLINTPQDKEADDRIFFYGLYNQLADDFADMFDDLQEGRVTPYTYYLQYQNERSDLLNPFELYLAVISHLIHDVYHSNEKTREVILARLINGLRRYKERVGAKEYNEVMRQFATRNKKFNRNLQKVIQKTDNVEFLDKILRDHILTHLKNEQKEQESFFKTIKTARNEINTFLSLPSNDHSLKQSLIDAANYSLRGDGKRIRPIVTWVVGVNEYDLDKKAIVPLLKSLEYMHTASLIFDDLPSQDNAFLRRGRPTLHEVYNVATAELTGLFLTQKAIEEQASLEQFNPKMVLKLIQYSAQTTAEMCKGQAMDLESKGKQLTLEQLKMLCFYKTGIAFEASLLMPAILAQANDLEIEALKKFAYHTGIAFQIKDDLLDVEGDQGLLGKPIRQDMKNNSSTFVTILGMDSARRAMWDQYCLAIEALEAVPRNTDFLKHLINYIVNRDH